MLISAGIKERRAAAVAATIERVRNIARTQGVNRESLAAIADVLTQLARRRELFPPQEFAVRNGFGSGYLLAEDADGTFALYGSAGLPGKSQRPHNHTTWAVIAGVYGSEHNVAYERTDDRSNPAAGELRYVSEKTLGPGDAVAYLPDDFHTIEVLGQESSLHLHLYGRSLEQLPDRVIFEGPHGGTLEPMAPASGVVKSW